MTILIILCTDISKDPTHGCNAFKHQVIQNLGIVNVISSGAEVKDLGWEDFPILTTF